MANEQLTSFSATTTSLSASPSKCHKKREDDISDDDSEMNAELYEDDPKYEIEDMLKD